MINKFDDPLGFTVKQNIDGIEVEYINIFEIGQGAPHSGKLRINGKPVSESQYFGGPLLVEHPFVYVPILVKKILGTGFKLCRIDTRTMDLKIIGPSHDLIFLDKIEGDRIYFSEDLDKKCLNFYDKREFDNIQKKKWEK